MAAFGVATLVGVGYVIGKKIIEKRREEEDLFFEFDGDYDDLMGEDGIDVEVFIEDCDECKAGKECKGNYGDKIKDAALFAVGAFKTGADKFGETIQDIKSKDMVKKGEQTIDAVKETSGNIKNDIKREVEDLKCMVASINDEQAPNEKVEDLFESAINAGEAAAGAVADAAEAVVDAVTDKVADVADALKDEDEI